MKPFYYRLDDGRLPFASEPWTLRGEQPQANLQAVHDYLAQGYLDHGDETGSSPGAGSCRPRTR